MSYLDKFTDTKEAYAKLPLYQAYKKIADGEITPQDLSVLTAIGARECLNTIMSDIPPEKTIGVYEKYIILKANSSDGLESNDAFILITFAKAIGKAAKDDVLRQEGEFGEFNLDVKAVGEEILSEADKVETSEQLREFGEKYKSKYEARFNELYEKALLIKGHADALEKLVPQIPALDDAEDAEKIEITKNIIKAYCGELNKACKLCTDIRELVKQVSGNTEPEKKEKPEKKENPDKVLLDKKKPEEIKKAVEENSFSTDKRKALAECLENEYPDQDIDSFEKLVWLDDTGKAAGKRLSAVKGIYGKSKTGGWTEKSVDKLANNYETAPEIPSRNVFWDIIIILASVALAALVAFHPAVAQFFEGASTPILAIITIIAFIIGANFGGFIAGIAVAFVWLVITYFVNKFVPFGTVLHIIVALALLIPAGFAIVDMSSKSKKSIEAAKAERRRYYDNLTDKCENMKDYLTSITEKIRALNAEGEDVEAAVKYYDKLKVRVSNIEENIRRNG